MSHPQAGYRLATGTRNGFYSELGQVLQDAFQRGSSSGHHIRILETSGSAENLRLLERQQADIALVQYDVAKASLDNGLVNPIAIVAQEKLFIISQECPESRAVEPHNSLELLLGRCGPVAIGQPESGIDFTARRLFADFGRVDKKTLVNMPLAIAAESLRDRRIGSMVYIGDLSSRRDLLRLLSTRGAYLQGLGIDVVNYLGARYPGVYRPAKILAGSVSLNPSLPTSDISSVSIPTVLLARSGLDRGFVKELAWSLILNYRKLIPYYPGLVDQDPGLAFASGLVEIDTDAASVYKDGDPSQAFWRLWNENSDLQAGAYLLLLSSLLGYGFQYWRKKRSAGIVLAVSSNLQQISMNVDEDPAKALRKIEQILDDIRLKYIGNRLSEEAYAVVGKRVQSLADRCRVSIDSKKRESILNALSVFDQWQDFRSSDAQKAVRLMSEMKSRCREMLLQGEIDIAAYIELMELMLLAEVATRG